MSTEERIKQLTRKGSAIHNIKVSKQLSTLVVNSTDVWNGYLQYGIQSIQGKRPEQEDSHLTVKKSEIAKEVSTVESPLSFFAIYDGHGGQRAAQYASENIYKVFLEKEKSTRNFQQVMKDAFAQVEEEILSKTKEDDTFTDGTTACVAVLKSHTMIVGNVGDTEMILVRRVREELRHIVLTEVHNANKNPKEAERVVKSGGTISESQKRVKHPRFPLCTIAVTRSLGDSFFKLNEHTDSRPSGIIAEPSIVEVSLTSKDDFAVIACDGVWDVLTYDQVAKFVELELKTHNSSQTAAENLVSKALASGSKDNITVVVLSFKDFSEKK